MFVGLVRTPSEPQVPHVPWRPFAWFAAFCWLMVLAGAVGGLAGYVIVLAAISLGCWRINRWCDTQYWGGLREIQR